MQALFIIALLALTAAGQPSENDPISSADTAITPSPTPTLTTDSPTETATSTNSSTSGLDDEPRNGTTAETSFAPLAPGPKDIYNVGSECDIRWTVDTTEQWKNVSIYLMAGPNNAMEKVQEVATGIDGTDPSTTSYSWKCPEVSPNSAIYFYQFTNGNDKMGSKWTTRFTIASSTGETTPPEHSSQPEGEPIPWGSGSVKGKKNKDGKSEGKSEDAGPGESPTAAQFTPTAPGPGSTFNAGATCDIRWAADGSGKWTDVSITLMSGSNTEMEKVKDVVSGINGTDTSNTSYSWPCPEVSPNSAIYFYQFVNGDDKMNATWTTRFAIASASGETEPPEHSKQPNGEPIPWGVGKVANSILSRICREC